MLLPLFLFFNQNRYLKTQDKPVEVEVEENNVEVEVEGGRNV